MLQNMWSVFFNKKEFFLDLLWEHLEISLLAIVIAILLGGTVGILISEFQKTAKPALSVINFLYTIPSISMLGFLIPFSGVGNATAVIALLLCLCIAGGALLPINGRDTIHIATKPMTEQYVMGEILDILIEQDTDLNVELTQGVGGGTSNIQPAMESGEFDIYPEYTGTAWNMVLKKEDLYTEDLFETMQEEYKNSFDMQWIGMYGFNNTYGLVVRCEIAEKYNLQTYSDLKAVSNQLVFGAEYDFFEREDGYDALCKTYGFTFKNTMDMDIGLKYQAINQGKIDVMVIFTTDGQLSVSDVTVLKDDKSFYPSYLCGNIIRSEVLTKHPELEEIFEKLTGVISDEDMAQMNYAVESEGKEPREVAEAFLQNAGLLK